MNANTFIVPQGYNVSSHKKIAFSQFSKIYVTSHPPYLSDLLPCGYSLLPILKTVMKEMFYNDALKTIPKTKMESLVDCAQLCVYVQGTYFQSKISFKIFY